jgi:hypothetical protein
MTHKIDYGCNTHDYPFACFVCRKSFKRPWVSLKTPYGLSRTEKTAFAQTARRFERDFRHKCPQCGAPSHFMGRDFKAPKTVDAKAWARVQRFILSGRTYHHGTPTDDVKWPLQRRNN